MSALGQFQVSVNREVSKLSWQASTRAESVHKRNGAVMEGTRVSSYERKVMPLLFLDFDGALHPDLAFRLPRATGSSFGHSPRCWENVRIPGRRRLHRSCMYHSRCAKLSPYSAYTGSRSNVSRRISSALRFSGM